MVDRNEKFRDTIRDFAHRDPDYMAEMYCNLIRELMSPPEGWSTFGTHAGLDDLGKTNLEWWGTGDDGLPPWERVVPSDG